MKNNLGKKFLLGSVALLSASVCALPLSNASALDIKKNNPSTPRISTYEGMETQSNSGSVKLGGKHGMRLRFDDIGDGIEIIEEKTINIVKKTTINKNDTVDQSTEPNPLNINPLTTQKQAPNTPSTPKQNTRIENNTQNQNTKTIPNQNTRIENNTQNQNTKTIPNQNTRIENNTQNQNTKTIPNQNTRIENNTQNQNTKTIPNQNTRIENNTQNQNAKTIPNQTIKENEHRNPVRTGEWNDRNNSSVRESLQKGSTLIGNQRNQQRVREWNERNRLMPRETIQNNETENRIKRITITAEFEYDNNQDGVIMLPETYKRNIRPLPAPILDPIKNPTHTQYQ